MASSALIEMKGSNNKVETNHGKKYYDTQTPDNILFVIAPTTRYATTVPTTTPNLPGVTTAINTITVSPTTDPPSLIQPTITSTATSSTTSQKKSL